MAIKSNIVYKKYKKFWWESAAQSPISKSGGKLVQMESVSLRLSVSLPHLVSSTDCKRVTLIQMKKNRNINIQQGKKIFKFSLVP